MADNIIAAGMSIAFAVLVCGGFALFYYLRRVFYKSKNPYYDRFLSLNETEFHRELLQQALNFKKSGKPTRLFALTTMRGLTPLTLGVILGAVLSLALMFGGALLNIYVFANDVNGRVLDSDHGFGVFIAILMTPFFLISLYMVIARRSRKFMHHLVYGVGWGKASWKKPSDQEISNNIRHLIKTGDFDLHQSYSDREITSRLFEMHNPIWNLFMKVFALVLIGAFVLDLTYRYDFTRDAFVHSPYFSFKNTVYNYSNLEGMEPQCRTVDVKGKQASQLDYYLYFENEKTFLVMNRYNKRRLRTIKYLKKKFPEIEKPMTVKPSQSENYDLNDCLVRLSANHTETELETLRSVFDF